MAHEEFVAKTQIQHPNLEVLSEYNGNKNYVTVRCKIHDHTFDTKPNWLNRGQGCQKCYDERRGASTRKTLQDYIDTVTEIHNGKYDYSQITDYKNIHAKIPVVCPKHGLFYINALHHQQGQGCAKCVHEEQGLSKRLPTDMFFNRCKEKHNNYYSYDETSFQGVNKLITIFCPIHGTFKQTAYAHMTGRGCPQCNASHLENSVKKLLGSIEYIQQYKFQELGIQSLDFYLPKYNIAIECQGGQHFFPVEHFGGEKEFARIQERDARKFDICACKGIKVIYIIDSKFKKELTEAFNTNNSIYTKYNTFILEEIDNIENIFS